MPTNLEPLPTPDSTPSVLNKKIILSPTLFGFGLGIISTLIVLIGLAFYVQNNQNSPANQVQVLPTYQPNQRGYGDTPVPIATSTTVPKPVLNLGQITWLQFPIVLADQSIFVKNEPHSNGGEFGYDLTSAKFHHVGNFADGSKLVNLIIDALGMGSTTEVHRLVIAKNGQVYSVNNEDYFNHIFLPSVKPAIINIDEIAPPLQLNLAKISLNRHSRTLFDDNYLSFTELQNPIFFESTKYGSVYTVSKSNTNYDPVESKYYYLRLKDDTLVQYSVNYDFMSDNWVPKLALVDNTINASAYQSGIRGGGCGASMGDLVAESRLSYQPLSKIGTLATKYQNNDAYKIIDVNNPILKLIYQEYKVGRDVTSQNFISSIDDFVQTQSHFLWKDDLGDWHIFTNNNYVALAECAKPVIYLYPAQDTTVSVKVGANVTLSEPTYPDNGWNVLAHPDGQLEYQGQSYPNLFWEGTGFGDYPDKSKFGVVVPQSELISTLNSQLKQLGLNDQESLDFMEFWTDKLPKTPYVRLTWLDTADMNQLAPLKVFPSPNTAIRIFLEFEGLQQPINLIPQKLSAPVRNGFTLVEWGGLLLK